LDKDGVLVDSAGHVESKEITAADGHTQVEYTVSVKKGMILHFIDKTPELENSLIPHKGKEFSTLPV
jgi:hypothetical protein